MPSANRIKLITFDAYNTLFKPKGSLSAQYVSATHLFLIPLTYAHCTYIFSYFLLHNSKKKNPHYTNKSQVEEASKYGLKVTREQINTHFGQAYKHQLLKAPFYGLSLGMTPQLWWKEVCV